MNYKNIKTGEIVSESHYLMLPESKRKDFIRTSANPTHYVHRTEESGDDGFLMSAIIGYVTDNALIGGMVGGNMMGGIVGDMMNGGDIMESNSHEIQSDPTPTYDPTPSNDSFSSSDYSSSSDFSSSSDSSSFGGSDF